MTTDPKLEANARIFLLRALRRFGQEPTEEQLSAAVAKVIAAVRLPRQSGAIRALGGKR